MAGEMAERIGANIRRGRMDLGLNQRELAERLGDDIAAGNQRISDWERGVNKPSDRYMQLLAKALEKDVAWFYEDHDKDDTVPDLMGSLNGNSQLDAILGAIKQLASQQERLAAALAAIGEEVVALRREMPRRRRSA